MPAHKSVAECTCVWACAATLLYWAASCLSDYPASSRCQICHLQMSGRACGAEEWREERVLKKKKNNRRGNRITGSADIWNMFRRVIKSRRVRTVLRGLRRWLLESCFSAFVGQFCFFHKKKKEKKKREATSYRSIHMGVPHKCVFADYLLSLLLSQELLSVQAFELFWSVLLLIVPWEKKKCI